MKFLEKTKLLMKKNVIALILYLLIISCGDKWEVDFGTGQTKGGGCAPPPQKRCYVDKKEVIQGDPRARIVIEVPPRMVIQDSETTYVYEERKVYWKYVDLDDPADNVDWLDPNGDDGGDNGFLGLGMEYWPAGPARFENEIGDSIDFSLSDNASRAEVWLRPRPDENDFYHPGDNWYVAGFLDAPDSPDTIFTDSIITAWKRLRLEYDYMANCEISFDNVELAFCGDLSANNNPYVEFKSTYIWTDETYLEVTTFESDTAAMEWAISHRNAQNPPRLDCPFYIAGTYVYKEAANETLGMTWADENSTFRISLIYVKNIKYHYPDTWQDFIKTATVHELGHQYAMLRHEDDEKHTEDCVMHRNVTHSWRFCSYCAGTMRHWKVKSPMLLGGKE